MGNMEIFKNRGSKNTILLKFSNYNLMILADYHHDTESAGGDSNSPEDLNSH